MKHKVISIIFALSILIGLSPVSPAFAEGVEMRGTARDVTFRPLNNAQIIVYDATNKQKITTAQTDSYGQYAFSLPQGSYDLELIDTSGEEPQTYTKKDLQVNAAMMQDLAFDPPVTTVAATTFSTSVSGFGLVPSIILLEVFVIGLGFLAYILFRRRKQLKPQAKHK
jgi:hypothetical protein